MSYYIQIHDYYLGTRLIKNINDDTFCYTYWIGEAQVFSTIEDAIRETFLGLHHIKNSVVNFYQEYVHIVDKGRNIVYNLTDIIHYNNQIINNIIKKSFDDYIVHIHHTIVDVRKRDLINIIKEDCPLALAYIDDQTYELLSKKTPIFHNILLLSNQEDISLLKMMDYEVKYLKYNVYEA